MITGADEAAIRKLPAPARPNSHRLRSLMMNRSPCGGRSTRQRHVSAAGLVSRHLADKALVECFEGSW